MTLVLTAQPATAATPLVSRRMTLVLGTVGVVLCAVVVAFVAQAAPERAGDRALVQLLGVGVPLAAGLYALSSPGNARFGMTLLAAALLWSLTALGESSDSLPYSIGRVCTWLIFPLLIDLMLTYPEGRLAGGLDRRLFHAANLLVALLYVGSALFVEQYPLYTPWATCTADCPANAFLVLDHEPALMASVVQPVRELLAVLVLTGVVVSMVARWRDASPLRRPAMGPVVVASSALIVLLAAFYAVRRLDGDSQTVEVVGVLCALSVPGVAAAFLLGLLRRRLQFAGVLLRLSGPLSDGISPIGMREALARALADPTLEVLVADQAPGRWRDLQGRLAPGPAGRDDGRPVTVFSDDRGARVALVHDPALRDDAELLDAVGALVLAAVHHGRLEAQLTKSLHALAVSRRRIARAADHERSRIERDLHDGAQQRLIRLRIKLSLAEELLEIDAERGARAVHELGEDVERTLDELRSLAHGVYPSILRDRGLDHALRTLAAETPLTVHIFMTGLTRHPQEVEAAVYYTIAEALQNAAKHAPAATSVRITLRQADGLELEVRDDGPGFVPGEQNGTSGLRNMRDRLEAVGGRFTIDTTPGHGTRILGRVPLDS